MRELNRRSFIKGGLLGAAAISIPARSWSQIPGANGDIRMAVVGFNGRGGAHIEGFGKLPGVRVAALCDVDQQVLDRQLKRFRDRQQPVERYRDVRKLLENKSIDAISIATPNHWHSLIGVWGCQAGKDVYVEKPVSHNVWEGRKLVEAARRYQRVVQTGTQSRSSQAWRDAVDWVGQGHLGKIKISRGLCYKYRPSIGKVEGPQPIPPSVDYDLWCGPAPKAPLMRKHLHYDWHWVWPTGNGDIGNQGIHEMDKSRWFLGKNHLSPKILAVGGRLGYVDDGETPNTLFAIHDYGDAYIIFEVRGLPARAGARQMDKYFGQSIGNIVECENGYLAGTAAYDFDGKRLQKFEGGGNHFANFIQAVRSRNASDLHAEILEGHLSSALCHTSNISYLLGKQADPDEIRERILSQKEALETFERMKAHLEINGVDLKTTKLTFGEFLTMDPERERFTNSDQANQLLTRHYRPPFVVPENV